MFDFQPGNERYRISLWYLGHRAIFRTQTSARVRDLDFLLLSTQIVRLQLVLIVQIDFFWRLERYADKPSETPAFRFLTFTNWIFQVNHPNGFILWDRRINVITLYPSPEHTIQSSSRRR